MYNSSLLKLLVVFLIIDKSISAVPSSRADSDRTPTLMVSLDGFRADKLDEFLKNNPNSFLQKYFVDVGVKAPYMTPAFPSLTFPNHFTLVTGLYPEYHGIVGNNFYDSAYGDKINFLKDPDSNDPKWWNGSDPIWLTAKNQGLKTASYFWTGSEAWPRSPDMYYKYDGAVTYEARCDQVVIWFQKFSMDFVTLYISEPDSTGHSFGADSVEYMNKIKDVDTLIGYLLKKLEAASLLENLNILIVSDHGMATMKSGADAIILKNWNVTTAFIDTVKSSFGVIANIYPKNDSLKAILYDQLKKVSHVKIYYKEDMPGNLNFNNGNRIAPIVVIADEAYTINLSDNFTLAGNHGFDPYTVDSMRAIFLARGPSFKKNVKIDPINTVDVYPLLCDLIKIKCNPNNGTIQPFLNSMVESSAVQTKFNISFILFFIILKFIQF